MKKFLKYLFLILLVVASILAFPELIYKNRGKSKAIGSVGNGSLENPYLMPYSGKNFRYFSPLSYYILDDAYLHSKVYATLLAAYQECEKTCEGVKFRVMECANKDGGKMWLHRTHQNGLSVDFMVPKKSGSKQTKWLDRLGLWHYLLEFTDEGESKLNQSIEIDFETMGKHILALDRAARANGLKINKVILKIELKDDFYATASGKKVKQKGIYFARSLSNIVNRVHDDHYHIDFEIVQ
ncbi:MAG: hypothetical protein AAFO82_14465 [Bacteroidota bacterium]